MKVVQDKEYFYVVLVHENKRVYKSHLRIDCEQYIFAKTRRWK